MKIFSKNILFLLLALFASFGAYSSHAQELDLLFNQESYFEKDSIIENGFFPELNINEVFDLYKTHLPFDQDPSRYIHINIDEADWEDFMNHYYSKHRFINRKFYPISGVIMEGENTREFSGHIKHRGNYSSKSLKVGFRLNLDSNLPEGSFGGKDKMVFRNLTFDRTGINESTYFDAYKQAHDANLGFETHFVEQEYFWVFINNKPYGYYLVMDDTKEDLLKNRDPDYVFDDAEDCLVKAKTWRKDFSANMQYHEEYEDDNFFFEIYRIEEGDEYACKQEMLEMMKKIQSQDYRYLRSKFRDLRQVMFYGQFQHLSNNKSGIFQNYLLLKQNGKWEIMPWDGDLSLGYINTFPAQEIKENPLIRMALNSYRGRFLPGRIKKVIAQNLEEKYEPNKSHIQLDRKIWSRYVSKDDFYSYVDYYKYATGEFSEKHVDTMITQIFLRTRRHVSS